MRLQVKVVPGSSRDGIVGWLGDVLKVRVTAPPERGKANAAVCAVLAKAVGVAVERVVVVAGHTSPRKVVEIGGLSVEQVRERLTRPAD